MVWTINFRSENNKANHIFNFAEQKKKKKEKGSAFYQHHEQVTDLTEQIWEFASVDYIIQQTGN